LKIEGKLNLSAASIANRMSLSISRRSAKPGIRAILLLACSFVLRSNSRRRSLPCRAVRVEVAEAAHTQRRSGRRSVTFPFAPGGRRTRHISARSRCPGNNRTLRLSGRWRPAPMLAHARPSSTTASRRDHAGWSVKRIVNSISVSSRSGSSERRIPDPAGIGPPTAPSRSGWSEHRTPGPPGI
jgi:hypothetical protein